MHRVRLPRNAIGPITMGHPWAFRDFRCDATAGEVVELCDAKNQVLAWGLADEGPIAIRVLGRGPAPADVASEISGRIRRADQLRFRLFQDGTDCWRVVNGAGDGLPGVVVDRYADVAVLRLYSIAWERHLDALVSALAGTGWPTSIYRRFGVARVDGRDGGERLHGTEPADAIVVTEHGMKLLVRPRVGQKTGAFLDQREHRALVRRWSSGRRTANLFAYNGGFSVAAALGGAATVTTVDLAPEAIEDARENFRLNDLSLDAHRFEVADVFKWEPRGQLDLLIVDPPSLTRSERSDRAAARAYEKLHRRLAPFLSRDGLLATASCTARLSLGEWRKAVADGLAPTADFSWHWVSGEPPDHPTALVHREARYLKFALLRRR